jgi:ribonuclease HI
MEVIQPYAVTPWEERLSTTIAPDREKAVAAANSTHGIQIATSSSERRGIVGMGGAIYDTLSNEPNRKPVTYSTTLGLRTEQNPYTAELAAIAMAMRYPPPSLIGRQITIFTSNQSALLAIGQPKHQSGQANIREVYQAASALRIRGNHILIAWVPSQGNFELGKEAKEAARRATEQGQLPQCQSHRTKSTTINIAKAMQREKRTLTEEVGRYTREMDTALPGKHTRTIYDALKRREANILAQLRTGMSRLNGYLHRIGVVESDQCACGQATETVKHFLFRCTRWDAYRTQMLERTGTRRGNLSFYLGGKAPSDPERWTPNMDAIRATIKYAMASGRLDTEPEPHSDNSPDPP